MRPIKVGILNRFLRVADDGLPTVLIKKKLKKTILKVPFLPLKIAFFWVSGNGKNFRSKSYMVTKSEISPQRKLGSLQNLKFKLIRNYLTTKKNFMKISA